MANPKPIYLNFIPSNSHMKHLTLLLCLFATVLHAQEKDRRAILVMSGNRSNISFSPDEKIWITNSSQEIYSTNHIDSIWHFTAIKTKSNINGGGTLKNISFFNKDTAIISGWIPYDSLGTKKGYYLTTNAGKTWELHEYPGDSWIYSVYTDSLGNAWMGGSKKDLFISSDFAHTWKKITLPFNFSEDTYSICMRDAQNGILTSKSGEILATHNNWDSAYSIEDPNGYTYWGQSKIAYWNNFIIQHCREIYYTDTSAINWKKFPTTIIDFSVDPETNQLFALSKNMQVLRFSSPAEFKTVSEKQLPYYIASITAKNGALYALSTKGLLYHVNDSTFKEITPYTYDKKIRFPEIFRRGQKINWAIERNHVYLSDTNFKNMYREAILDFEVTDCKLINDSTAMLWDTLKNNYIFSLHDHSLQKKEFIHPISSFISSPITSFSIRSAISSCYLYVRDSACFRAINDSIFKGKAISFGRKKKRRYPITYANINTLNSVLHSIDEQPNAKPGILDFGINNVDKENFKNLIDYMEKQEYRNNLTMGKSEYHTNLDALDSTENSLLNQVIEKTERGFSTTGQYFLVSIINASNDTLSIFHHCYIELKSWNLPWYIEYKGLRFPSSSIQLSKFIKSCLPEGFLGKYYFDNKFLIKEIADYPYTKDK